MHAFMRLGDYFLKMNNKKVKEHEEAIFTLHIFDALYDLLWHDILNFFTLPLGIRDVHNTNWHRVHGKFTIRDYFRTLFREIIG